MEPLISENVRDWPEDFQHENGNYVSTCCLCGEQFRGHKRRVGCKSCATAPPPRPLEQEQWTAETVFKLLYDREFAGRGTSNTKAVADAHNTSLRALQEELVAAKLRIKDLEEKEA